MAHEIGWYRDGRVIVAHFYGNVSVDDIAAAFKFVGPAVENGTPLVHVITSLEGVTKFPIQLKQISQMTGVLHHPSMGWSVMVSDNTFAKYGGSVLTQLAKARFRIVNSMDAALAFIAYVDSSLEDLATNAEFVKVG